MRPSGGSYSPYATAVAATNVAKGKLGRVAVIGFVAMMGALAQATGMRLRIRSRQRERGNISRERNEQQ
jgi:hypothetical protein